MVLLFVLHKACAPLKTVLIQKWLLKDKEFLLLMGCFCYVPQKEVKMVETLTCSD